jgi:hypothetical protein
MNTENAAPPASVRDVIQANGLRLDANEIVSLLGIDPDMPVETLKRRLLWGERVEEGNDLLVRAGGSVTSDAEYHAWLTRPENPPSQVLE